MGDLKREPDLNEGWSGADASAARSSEVDERPSRRILPERTNTPAMPWGISVMPPALTVADAAPVAAPAPPAPRPMPEPVPRIDEVTPSARPGARERDLPAPIDRVERDPAKKKVGLVRVGRPVATAPQAYELGPQLASHLAWLDDDGRRDLERHLSRGEHRKALAMIANAKKTYPKNVSIGRCAQIVERAALPREHSGRIALRPWARR